MKKTKRARRPFTLLEVLIALVLVVLCAIPLLSPHVSCVHAHKTLLRTLEADRHLNLLYVDMLERLHKGDIPWATLQEDRDQPVDQATLTRLEIPKDEFPFQASYRFKSLGAKKNESDGWQMHRLQLTFNLKPENDLTKSESHAYTFALLRHAPLEAQSTKPKEGS